MRGERLILVGGSPRSGTTLVQRVLDSHPDVAGGPEFDHLPDVAALRRRLLGGIARGRIDAFCAPADVDDAIGTLVESLLLPYADRRKKRFLSEKTPSNVLVFEELREVLPAARFVVCVRDPRAVVASLLEVGDRARSTDRDVEQVCRTLPAAIDTVRTHLAAGFEFARRFDCTVVKYEDLTTAPEPTTRALCASLGLRWDEAMIRPEGASPDMRADQVWYTKEMLDRGIDAKSIDRWKTRLSPVEQQAVALAFEGDADLAALGYDLSLSRVERAAAAGYSAYASTRESAGIRTRQVWRFLERRIRSFSAANAPKPPGEPRG